MSAHIKISKSVPHIDCLQGSLWETDGKGYLKENRHTVGEVRRCRHGKVILCYQLGYTTRTVHNVRTPLWRTLSPFWNPTLYKRAVSALEEQT